MSFDEIDAFIGARTSRVRVACRKGCHWCCHQLVVLTCRDDGRRILAAARKRLTAAEFARVEAEVRAQDAAIRDMGHEAAEALRWTCPLLRDGLCTVYDVRPVACRSVVSPDAECCRRMMEVERFEDLAAEHQALATRIGELALELQVAVNDRRPVDGAVELRQLLRELLDEEAAG